MSLDNFSNHFGSVNNLKHKLNYITSMQFFILYPNMKSDLRKSIENPDEKDGGA